MGTAVRTAKTHPASWDAFSDVDGFVDEVLVELAAMAGTKPTRSGPKPALTGAALRKAIMAIWCLCFCSGAPSDSSAISRSIRCSPCSLAGPGLGCGAACLTGCAAPGSWPAVTPPSQVLSSSTVDPAGRPRAASAVASMAARRSTASRFTWASTPEGQRS
jgi:hypothetical protein